MQRSFISSAALLALALASSAPAALAQTHKVANQEDVVRAVGVYEWTGDMAKPTASRFIPVSLFIDGKLVDAAVYLARPVPLALLTGNLYEVQRAGIAKGTLDLLYSRHFGATDQALTAYDDGWFGYGKFAPPAPPAKSKLKPSKTLAVIHPIDDEDDPKPHFSAKSATPGSGGAASSIPAPAASTDTPADDPDRPTMRRHPDTSDQTASTTTKSTDTPADDPDRPTLRRRSAADTKQKDDQARVVPSADSLNDDPSRPTLHRGKPASALTLADFPKLTGLPADQDLHQMVAVSDSATRAPHDFAREWDDPAQHNAILSKMQAAARAQLAAYTGPAKPSTIAPPDTRHINSKARRAYTPDTAPPPSQPLVDEDLKAFLLSYGGTPTYVYSAHTEGLGETLRYVTLVAQTDPQGNLQIAIHTVTDATHLDRTPRMKLVDAVDAEASNRASLLFELRGQTSRQFALYRVIGARATQTFLTGTTQ